MSLIHLKAAKNAAKRLQNALKGAGSPAQLSLCQTMIAKAYGYKDWHHLAAVVGTPNAPRVNATANLEAALRANWPSLAAKAPDIAAAATGLTHDPGSPDTIDALRRSWLAGAPELKPKDYENHLNPFFPIKSTTMPALEAHPDVSIRIETMTNDDTLSTAMPIHDIIFNFRRANEPIGYIHLTVYSRKNKQTMSPQYIVEVADMISDRDVWSVKNILREHKNLFDNAVCLLNTWILAPQERGKGLGVALLAAALAYCKTRYSRLQSVAYDPNTTDKKFNPYIGPLKGAVVINARERVNRLIAEALSTKPLGPTGSAAPFSNARQGNHIQTLHEIGRQQVESGFDPGDQLVNPERAEENQLRIFNAIAASARAATAEPPPTIMLGKDYPNGWSPLAITLGMPVNPFPGFKNHMPRELTKIFITFDPPDITLRDPAVVNRPRFFNLTFANGKTIRIVPREIPSLDLDMQQIAEIDKAKPQSVYAPSLGEGTFIGVVTSNIRLLFGIDCTAEAMNNVPITVTCSLNPPTTAVNILHWAEFPGNPGWNTVKRHLDDTFATARAEVATAVRDLARAVIADGIYLARELYDDVWQGRNVMRQRFNETRFGFDVAQKTFKDIGSTLSPGQPYDDCPAHECFGDRLKRTIVAILIKKITNLFTAHQELLPMPLSQDPAAPLDVQIANMTYYSAFWEWWFNSVYDQIEQYQKTPIGQIAEAASA